MTCTDFSFTIFCFTNSQSLQQLIENGPEPFSMLVIIYFGHVFFRANPSLGIQSVAFDVVTIVDSEERFHGITDSDALPNLLCNRVIHPLGDAH